MPSELQRVARGLVDCFDEVPRVVDHLQRTAARCRENAQLALQASHGQATVAAQQLDAAARACEAAAHYLLMAPPKARSWAESLIGDGGPTTNRPSSDSADRIKLPGGASGRDSQGRTKRLSATFGDLEVADDNEPPLVTVARKAFERFRKEREKDEENQDLSEEPLEVEITITESGEVEFEERDKTEEQKREERLLRDFEIEADLTEQVKRHLESMADSQDQQWQRATIVITGNQIEATFDYPDDDHPQPITVDINLPPLPTADTLDFDAAPPDPIDVDFDPAVRLGALGDDFAAGVFDPYDRFLAKEIHIAERLREEGWRVDARPADHGSGKKNPDSMIRKNRADEGVIVEFKTQDVAESSAVKRSMLKASAQARETATALGARHEVVIDGRPVGLSEETARRSFRRAVGQPHSTVAPVVHVILGDGRLVTFIKEL